MQGFPGVDCFSLEWLRKKISNSRRFPSSVLAGSAIPKSHSWSSRFKRRCGRNARVSLIPEQLFSVPGMRDFLEWSTLLGLLASSYGSLVNNLTLTTAFPTKDWKKSQWASSVVLLESTFCIFWKKDVFRALVEWKAQGFSGGISLL